MTAARHILVGAAFFIVDQASKVAVRQGWVEGSWGPLRITATYNSGFAFSLPGHQTIALLASVSVLLALAVLAWRVPRGPMRWGVVLILAGGSSNLLDRAIYGSITDIAARGSLLFNLADIYIVSGILVVGIQILRKYSNATSC